MSNSRFAQGYAVCEGSVRSIYHYEREPFASAMNKSGMRACTYEASSAQERNPVDFDTPKR
jgi:hypothetical protein